MTVRFLEIAEIELDQAIHWYRAQAPGLDDAFLIEVLSAADRMARFPEVWHPLGDGIRRCRLSRFPYGLIYTVDKGDILVLAVAHLHRRPDYWRIAWRDDHPPGNECRYGTGDCKARRLYITDAVTGVRSHSFASPPG